jgi:hypothetical protein
MTAGTFDAQGTLMAPPDSTTTTVRGFAAATAERLAVEFEDLVDQVRVLGGIVTVDQVAEGPAERANEGSPLSMTWKMSGVRVPQSPQRSIVVVQRNVHPRPC